METDELWTVAGARRLLLLEEERIGALGEYLHELEARVARDQLVERAALALWAWCAEEAVLSPAGRQEQSRQEQSRLARLCWDAAVIFAEQSRGFAAGHERKEP